MAGLFQVLWGQPDGSFKKAAVLNGTDGQPLIIPVEKEQWTENICTRPFAVDWDHDGQLDLVVGNFVGTFYLFKGQGKGKFLPTPEPIKAGDQPLKIEGHHSDPFVVDWDGDGDLDLLSGSSEGGVQWAENRAGPGKPPQLAAFRSLIPPGPQVEYGQVLREEDLKGPLNSTRVWVDDFNSDGKLDLLVGDLVTLISPAGNLTEKEFKEQFADWMKSINEASKQVNSTKDEKERNEARQRFQELARQRSEFMKEDRTGFVWLYLRK
ncbi:MAG: VCBS repeat-containing protein [Planctomycetes bacterium]|nr:VCBS repeat-containing protein [Planctomycetota bacterium]